MSLRLRCRWSGCREEEYGPACERCGEELYGGAFVMWGDSWRYRLGVRLTKVLRPLRWFLGHRCEVCGRRFWRQLRPGDDDRPPICSEACFDKWIPF
jgi:hypothetical protein